jgi:pimeloyl-ACP methyl ester carboxylesterase
MSASASASDVRDEVVSVWNGRLHLHVKVAGGGPPLVFFHPLPGLAWQPLLDRLAETYTVYAPEHPGTSAGDHKAIHLVDTFSDLMLIYEETIRQLGLERPLVIGQSFGGMVAADLAATFPSLASKLVLLSPIGLWLDDVPTRLGDMLTGPPEETPDYLFIDPQGEGARAVLALPPDPELIPKAIAQMVWNIGCTTKFAWPIADHGLAQRLHRVATPTLIVWGKQDALVPVEYADEFASRIQGSRVEIIDGCGHVLQVDQPEQTWTAISGFLSTA